MSTENYISLNLNSRILSYQDNPLTKQSPSIGEQIISVTISILAYPLIASIGAISLIIGLCRYSKASALHSKMVTILSDSTKLNEYAHQKIGIVDAKIKTLQHHSYFHFQIVLKHSKFQQHKNAADEILKKSEKLGLGEKMIFVSDELLLVDFDEKLEDSQNGELQWALNKLKNIKMELPTLLKQKNILSNSNANDKIQAITNIANLSLIKIEFHKQEAKTLVYKAILSLIPGGGCLQKYFTPVDARLKYAGKKEFLPKDLSNTYADLLDAHNSLAKQNDYLMPYIPAKPN